MPGSSTLVVILLAATTGCAVQPSRCEEAAAAVANCTGAVPDDFVEACEQAPDGEADALVDSMLEATCDGAAAGGGKADGLAEGAFVEACRTAVGAAYLINRVRSPAAVPLAPDLREQLRFAYGSLVDTVGVSWSSTMVDKWKIGRFDVNLGFDVEAQTFGNHIFIAEDAYRPDYWPQLSMIVHELEHARQARDRGGPIGFADAYCRAFWASNFSYENNALEEEARAAELRIQQCLAFGCESP
jgi:hypothetical protein